MCGNLNRFILYSLENLEFDVNGVNVVARSEIRMGFAVKLIVHIFIYSGPIFIAAVEISLWL